MATCFAVEVSCNNTLVIHRREVETYCLRLDPGQSISDDGPRVICPDACWDEFARNPRNESQWEGACVDADTGAKLLPRIVSSSKDTRYVHSVTEVQLPNREVGLSTMPFLELGLSLWSWASRSTASPPSGRLSECCFGRSLTPDIPRFVYSGFRIRCTDDFKRDRKWERPLMAHATEPKFHQSVVPYINMLN